MDRDRIRELVLSSGAVASGVAQALPVEDWDREIYRSWTACGRHAGMDYMERYGEVRMDPRLLLEGARSVIVAAYRYPGLGTATGPLRWARYAVGTDYHEVVRARLGRVAEAIENATGEKCRVTVDTAPMRERYWAVKAGVGFTGRNGLLIVPGVGSMVVIGCIVTTLALEESPSEGDDRSETRGCAECERCVKACPGGALDGSGSVDARRCMSYLTVEARGEDSLRGEAGAHVSRSGRIYGCDICQEVCPYNQGTSGEEYSAGRAMSGAVLEEFMPRAAVMGLTREDILGMSQEEFSRIFSHSAIKRVKLAGLRRNASQ